jgi:hypothetical protein
MDIHEYHLCEKNTELDKFVQDKGFFKHKSKCCLLWYLLLGYQYISLY